MANTHNMNCFMISVYDPHTGNSIEGLKKSWTSLTFEVPHFHLEKHPEASAL